jgi:predicted chitinase
MTLTKDQIIALLHGNSEAAAWADAALEILPQYEINTPNRIAGFFAQLLGTDWAENPMFQKNFFKLINVKFLV